MNEELFYEALEETKKRFENDALNDTVKEIVSLFNPKMSLFTFVYLCTNNIILSVKNKEEKVARFYQNFLSKYVEKEFQEKA